MRDREISKTVCKKEKERMSQNIEKRKYEALRKGKRGDSQRKRWEIKRGGTPRRHRGVRTEVDRKKRKEIKTREEEKRKYLHWGKERKETAQKRGEI